MVFTLYDSEGGYIDTDSVGPKIANQVNRHIETVCHTHAMTDYIEKVTAIAGDGSTISGGEFSVDCYIPDDTEPCSAAAAPSAAFRGIRCFRTATGGYSHAELLTSPCKALDPDGTEPVNEAQHQTLRQVTRGSGGLAAWVISDANVVSAASGRAVRVVVEISLHDGRRSVVDEITPRTTPECRMDVGPYCRGRGKRAVGLIWVRCHRDVARVRMHFDNDRAVDRDVAVSAATDEGFAVFPLEGPESPKVVECFDHAGSSLSSVAVGDPRLAAPHDAERGQE